MGDTAEPDFGLAFGVTCGAGLSTALGAAVVFVPRLYSHRVLAGSLALSAGVMLYVSLIEIFNKGLSDFQAHFDQQAGVNRSVISAAEYEPPAMAYYMNTLAFFGGIILTYVLNLVTRALHNCVVSGQGHLSDGSDMPSKVYYGGGGDADAAGPPLDGGGQKSFPQSGEGGGGARGQGQVGGKTAAAAAAAATLETPPTLPTALPLQQQQVISTASSNSSSSGGGGGSSGRDSMMAMFGHPQPVMRHSVSAASDLARLQLELDPLHMHYSSDTGSGSGGGGGGGGDIVNNGRSVTWSKRGRGFPRFERRTVDFDAILSGARPVETNATGGARGKQVVVVSLRDQPDESASAKGAVNFASEEEGEGEEKEELNVDRVEGKAARRLVSMALVTGLSIFLHNIPEGLATFVATARDPSVGASLAVAIAIHNIPEGICVAIPIYFATQNKWRAFFFATASGLAEPIAAAIGWGILASNRNNNDSGGGGGDGLDSLTYAILFSFVAGMMTEITMTELFPLALCYDMENRVVTIAFFVGMAIMALSLTLFV